MQLKSQHDVGNQFLISDYNLILSPKKLESHIIEKKISKAFKEK